MSSLVTSTSASPPSRCAARASGCKSSFNLSKPPPTQTRIIQQCHDRDDAAATPPHPTFVVSRCLREPRSMRVSCAKVADDLFTHDSSKTSSTYLDDGTRRSRVPDVARDIDDKLRRRPSDAPLLLWTLAKEEELDDVLKRPAGLLATASRQQRARLDEHQTGGVQVHCPHTRPSSAVPEECLHR